MCHHVCIYVCACVGMYVHVSMGVCKSYGELDPLEVEFQEVLIPNMGARKSHSDLPKEKHVFLILVITEPSL